MLAKPRKARHKPRPTAVPKTPPTLARWSSVRSAGGSAKALAGFGMGSNRHLMSINEADEKSISQKSITVGSNGNTAQAGSSRDDAVVPFNNGEQLSADGGNGEGSEAAADLGNEFQIRGHNAS